jgi:hypothetical protein
MFYAVIRGKDLTFNKDAILVFETVIVNEGEHYDPFDGVLSSRSYPGMISLFHFTKSGHRSWRMASGSILFSGRRNCILFYYQFTNNPDNEY